MGNCYTEVYVFRREDPQTLEVRKLVLHAKRTLRPVVTPSGITQTVEYTLKLMQLEVPDYTPIEAKFSLGLGSVPVDIRCPRERSFETDEWHQISTPLKPIYMPEE